MATLNQLASEIVGLLGKQGNHEMTERVKDSFRHLRATRIRQSIQKEGIYDTYKVAYDFEFEKTDKLLSCKIDIGCVVLKSKTPIPSRIRRDGYDIPIYAGTLDGRTFTYLRYNEIRYASLLPFRDNVIYYQIIRESDGNEYLYVWTNIRLKYGRIIDIFEDLKAVAMTCATNECYTDDSAFPIAEDMIQSIKMEILNEFRFNFKSDIDEVNMNTTNENTK